MIRIGVEVDRAQLADAISLFEFYGGNSSEALSVAINKAGPKVRTASSKAIREQVRLKAAYVKGKVSFKRATRQKLSGRISVTSRGMLLPRYSTDAAIANSSTKWVKPPPIPKRGIRVKVKPDGSAKVLRGDWFYMVLKNSNALAIARRRPADQPGRDGGKIKVAYGPSISQVFGTETRERLLPMAADELQHQFLDAMRYLLQKKHPA